MHAHSEGILLRWKLRKTVGILLVALAIFFPVRLHAEATASSGVAGIENSNSAPVRDLPPPPVPAAPETKTKARFLAAGGLAILSLLILASGLALIRAFKKH